MTESTWIETLIMLAKAGAAKGDIRVSSSWLAERLGGSKQTAIRRLTELEERSLITRAIETRGQVLRISPAGLASLRAVQKELEGILKPSPVALSLSGRVVTGMGEGGYYVGQEKYADQFEKQLGFRPYPGTLDVKLERDAAGMKEALMRMPAKQIGGFETSERTFGPVKFFEARLKGTRAAIVMPDRTSHTNVLEIIAPRNLRKALGLKDGDIVSVEVLS